MTVTWTTAGWIVVILLGFGIVGLLSSILTELRHMVAMLTTIAVAVQEFVQPVQDREKPH